MVRCFLVLENGTVLEGVSFGHESAVTGEIVFTTCMAGYQESITDPAYKGQILVSAFPLIGDYGVNDKYDISGAAHVAGLVVREYCKEPSDMYGGRTLDDYLREQKVPGISGIDTRDIIREIRSKGTMNAAIVHDEKEAEKIKKRLKATNEENLVGLVSTKAVKRMDNGKGVSVGIIDCGADRRMIGDLSSKYDIVIFPYDTKPSDITGAGVKCVIVSGGPGSPEHPDIVRTVVRTVKELSATVPIAGVALGSQIIAKAFGCKVIKLKAGHHGPNQPVKHGDRVHITLQNHMYAVDPASMDGTGLVADQFNVNDGTLEGFSHLRLPIFGIHYQPMSPLYEKDSYFYKKIDEITGVGP